MLNNLSKVCWKWKNADIICYKLISLDSCKKVMSKNPKNQGKLMKIADINREFLPGKIYFKIILKVTKKQGFTSPLHPLPLFQTLSINLSKQ